MVRNTLSLIEKEISKTRDKIKSVFLCLTTDPFMVGYPEIHDMTMSSIRLLNGAGIRCKVLTKGLLPIELSKCTDAENDYGITVCSTDEKIRKRYEPNAAPIYDRIAHLKALYDNGCKTWLSIEPYLPVGAFPISDKEDDREDRYIVDILDAVPFVDSVVFGKLNYNKAVSDALERDGYSGFMKNATYLNQIRCLFRKCKTRGIKCYVKNGTRPGIK